MKLNYRYVLQAVSERRRSAGRAKKTATGEALAAAGGPWRRGEKTASRRIEVLNPCVEMPNNSFAVSCRGDERDETGGVMSDDDPPLMRLRFQKIQTSQ